MPMAFQAATELTLRQQDYRKRRAGTPPSCAMQEPTAAIRKSDETSADESAPRIINFKLGDRSIDSLSFSVTSSASTRTSTVTRSSSPSYSHGPLSPASFSSISSMHSPPSIAGMSFCHSRDSSLDTDATGLSFYSGDLPDPSLEDDDDDLRAYRLGESKRCTVPDSTSADTSVVGCDDLQDEESVSISNATVYKERDVVMDDDARSVIRCEDTASRIVNDNQDETILPATSDVDMNLDASAHNLAKRILDDEFEVFLGRSEPPSDIVEAVRACLDEISLSLRDVQHLGVFVPHTAAPHSDKPANQPPSNPTTGNSGSHSRSNGQRKRSSQNLGGGDRDLQEEDSGGEDDTAGGQPDTPQQRKKLKCEPEEYPCPFRKRNPVRFNCRDFEYCAKAPFKSMTDLKKHIIKYHKRQQEQQQCAFSCVRCHLGFVKFEDWHEHMTRDPENMCKTTSPPTSEDGISRSLDSRLRGRSEHFTWVTLWRSLFDDSEVPDPVFEPIVELHEVRAEYESGLADFQLRLESTVATLLASNRGPNSQHLLCGNLDNLFKDFTATVFRKALSAASTQPRPARPRVERTPSETPSQPVRATSFAGAAAEPVLRPILPSAAGGSSSNRSSSVSSSAWLSPATTRQSHQSFSSDSSASRGSKPTLALPVHHRHVPAVGRPEIQCVDDTQFHSNSHRDSAIDVEGPYSVLFPLPEQIRDGDFENLVDFSLCDGNLNFGDVDACFDVSHGESAVVDEESETNNLFRA